MNRSMNTKMSQSQSAELLNKITLSPLTTDQYVNESADKYQIYLHHTAGSPNPYAVIHNWWQRTPARIATAFVIGGFPEFSTATWKDGDIIQAFNSSKWAWHLGLATKHLAKGGSTKKSNTYLHKHSIGIELCNWGWLTQTNRGFETYVKSVVPDSQVEELAIPYRGYKYYHKYTDAQLDSVNSLLLFLCNKWKIPTQLQSSDIFSISPAALQGVPGIWTHTSVRPDKTDCYPSPRLISLLESL